jgi:hypothetical protein
MAKNKQTVPAQAAADAAQINATAGANGSTDTAAGSTGGKRGPRNPEDVLAWGEDRDAALIMTIMGRPNHYTTVSLAPELAKHPAFVDDARLLLGDDGPEKLRQRVKKISDKLVEKGLPVLPIRRRSNAGYDLDATIDKLYGRGGPSQAVQGQVAQAAPAYQAPQPAVNPFAVGTPVPVSGAALPTGTGLSGGLIPTTGG